MDGSTELPCIGDRVLLRGCFGNGALVEAEVTGLGEEAGQPVIDYKDPAEATPRLQKWAYLNQIERVVARAPTPDGGAFASAPPRTQLLAALMRLEAMDLEEGAVCRRIYCRSDLADEIALPDVNAGARIIRILNGIDPINCAAHEQARIGILAVCELLAPLTGEAA